MIFTQVKILFHLSNRSHYSFIIFSRTDMYGVQRAAPAPHPGPGAPPNGLHMDITANSGGVGEQFISNILLSRFGALSSGTWLS